MLSRLAGSESIDFGSIFGILNDVKSDVLLTTAFQGDTETLFLLEEGFFCYTRAQPRNGRGERVCGVHNFVIKN